MSELLKQAIRERGRVEGDLVMVDGFLNHLVDPVIIEDLGRFLAAAVGPTDLIVTSEASGIAPGYAAAHQLGVPLLFAKKRPNPPSEGLSRRVASPTKGDRPWLSIAPHLLEGTRSAAVVDDFLSGGRTALALGEMLSAAGIAVPVMAFAIEKVWTGGRRLLQDAGYRVVAAATIRGFEGGAADVT